MKELLLNKEIYSPHKIQEAVLAFNELSNVVVSDYENYLLLAFTKCKYDELRTIKEFENYLIGLENI